MGSTTPLKFKQGLDENLEQVAHDEGTVYIAKAGNHRAFMYADLDNVRYNITTPNKTYYGVSPEVKPDEPTNDNWQKIKTVTCDDFVLEPGATITVLFSSSLHLFNATLNVSNSGAIPIAYRGEVSSNKFLPANSVYTFIYINGKFHLVGDIDQVNNGMTIKEVDNDTAQGGYLFTVEEPSKSATGELNIQSPIHVDAYGNVTFPEDSTMRVPHGAIIVGEDEGTTRITPSGIDLMMESDQFYIYPIGNNLYFEGDNGGGMRLNSMNDTLYAGTVSASLLTGAQVWQAGRRVPNVWYGTTPPDSSIGQDGDIYIMYS
jgi:hypothetical protein